MLVGWHQRSLDEKGRVVLPAKFREHVADGCVITKGQDRCLFVYTLERWEEEEERVRRLPRTDRRNRNFSRAFFASADHQVPDRQGRVQISGQLREYANLQKDVTVVGMSDRMELWDSTAWDETSGAADDYYADIEEVLSEHGI